ncbi:MAG: hypothetical protein LUH05_07920 [Candidatus Gastranaerophilales bacterium]|nr:hypothetical protein [Candidatus Gastranaerophilales bacterium]
MRVNFNTYNNYSVSMKANTTSRTGNGAKSETELKRLLEPFALNKKAKVPPLHIMKGINPNNNDVFDSFTKIDDATRQINFVKSQSAWDDCLLEEIEEFKVARKDYEINKTVQNYDHMEEEMGDIFYTAASIAKDSGIDPKEAFKATNRKFYNRINIMERLCSFSDNKTPSSLKDCKDYERRALWNAAKRKLYDAQSLQYQN